MVREEILNALATVTGIPKEEIVVEVPADESHGDYSSNVAMKVASKDNLNPRNVAEDIIDKLTKLTQLTSLTKEISVAGPGFINFKLSNEYLLKTVQDIVNQGNEYGAGTVGKGKVALVEYSSPNIAKGFGIGHLRSTIIGQALFNVLGKLGYEVVGVNHPGDWGTQFGMVLAQINRKGLRAEELSVEELEKLYVEFNREMDEDPSLRELAKEWFRKIEQGDPDARSQWEAIRETSMKEFERMYDLLDVHIEHLHGESFYEDKMQAVIDEFREKGLTTMSEGAEIVELEGMPPAMLLKSDGTTTYFTRDLAAIRYRRKTWNPSIMIYEVGSDQILHFRQVFAAAEKIGWSEKIHYEHVAHGMIRFPEGKMSTRKGKTIKLEAVLNEAIARAKEIITESETNRGLSDDEVELLSKQVGIGAVKYFDLIHAPQSEIVFDWNKMFVLQGNSGPYLQYTFARTQSIMKKSETLDSKQGKNLEFSVTRPNEVTDMERGVMSHLMHYPEVVETVGKMYSPNIMANYLHELAQRFNSFYNADKILTQDPDLTNYRLLITTATSIVLKDGLELLGIATPNKM